MTTPKEPTACALCGTDPALGHAIVYDDASPSGQATHLCHGENQKISCYVQWTVYGTRPEGFKAPQSQTIGEIINQPFRELTDEFRRLAAEASAEVQTATDEAVASWHLAESQIWEHAAQMVEERLNGS